MIEFSIKFPTPYSTGFGQLMFSKCFFGFFAIFLSIAVYIFFNYMGKLNLTTLSIALFVNLSIGYYGSMTN